MPSITYNDGLEAAEVGNEVADPTFFNHMNNDDADHQPAVIEQATRRSDRPRQPSILLKDFVCTMPAVRYPINKFVNYSACSLEYQHYTLQVLSDLEPRTYQEAQKVSEWQKAMEAEITALEANQTWDITDLPPGKNVVGCKWVFKVKRRSDGSIERQKA